MNTDQVIDSVAPLLGTKWGYADDYRRFIGPRCPVCQHRGCDNPACLASARRAVQETETVKGMARLLGVTGHE